MAPGRPPGPSRRSAIAPFIVMDVMKAANARAAAGGVVLHLEVGEPGGGAPPSALAAARAALDAGNGAGLGYTEALGLPALRQRLARHYAGTYDLAVAPERIIVTTGSSAGFQLAFLACFDAGDRVALAEPAYPAYRNILAALGLEAVLLPAGPETRFQPSPAMLEAMEVPVQGLLVASPANPTGCLLPQPDLAALAGWCRAAGVRLIADEIYHGLVYGNAAATALAEDDEAIVVNSFSKYYGMTGWRVGWMVVPEDLVRAVERLAQNLFISAPAISQRAALAAFDDRALLDARVAAYGRSRALLLEALPQAGFGAIAPADGAFYLYAESGGLDADSEALCRRLLAETGVAITPGTDFDRRRGQGYVRFSFAGAEADIAEAARRLRAWRR